jgi:predicted DNA-binding protein
MAEESYALHVRIPKSLQERLDAEASALGIKRAAFVRTLIAQAMGDETHLAVLRETFYRLAPVMRQAVDRALAEAYGRLPDIIADELGTQNADMAAE